MVKVLIISDGKPGHENQSLGIAERVAGVEVLLFKHSMKQDLNEAVLRWGIGRTRGRIESQTAMSKLKNYFSVAEIDEVEKFSPDLLISAGSTSAWINLLFKGWLKIPSICIMRPSLIPLDAFDLAILPAHDSAPNLANVVRLVVTPNRASKDRAEIAADAFAKKIGRPRNSRYLGVIIGGAAKGMTFDEKACFDMLDAVYRWASEHDIILLITTSRRTGNRIESVIEERWGGDPHTGYLLLAGRSPENPTYAFYGMAGLAVITSDSISMVSEAVYAGVRPVVVDISGGAVLKGKRGRFYDGMKGQRYIDFASSLDDLTRTLTMSVSFSGAGVPDELRVCMRRVEGLIQRR